MLDFNGRKTTSPSELEKAYASSGSESPIRFYKYGLVRSAKGRFTKLILVYGRIPVSVRNSLGIGTLLGWDFFRMYEVSKTTSGHSDNKSTSNKIEDKQRSKAEQHGRHGTVGFPKGRKTHGYRVFVVGSDINRRKTGFILSYQTFIIRTYVCDKLGDLKSANLKNTGLVNRKIIYVISDISTLILAYELVKNECKKTSPGVNPKSNLDDINLTWLKNVSKQLKAGTYRFLSCEEFYIAKYCKSKKHPLPWDYSRQKVIEKAIQLTLEAIFDPCFLDCSHEFRPSRGAHSGLKKFKSTFHKVKWVIKPNILKGFNTVHQKVLLSLIMAKVKCPKTLRLIRSLVESKYINSNKFFLSAIENRQNDSLKSLLCNIYMHSLDTYIEKLNLDFDQIRNTRKNKLFRKLQYQIIKVKTLKDKIKIKSQIWSIKRKNSATLKPQNLVYIRYANDFVIGVKTNYKESIIIKNLVKHYLINNLKLFMNKNKVEIKDLNRISIFFLKIILKGTHQKSSKLKRKNRITTKISLHAPIENLFKKGLNNGFFRPGVHGLQPTSVGRLTHIEHSNIIENFNKIIRGLLNYYSFVDNKKSLGLLIHALKHSCALTLALKYKLRHASKVFRLYGPNLKDKTTGKGLDFFCKPLGKTNNFAKK